MFFPYARILPMHLTILIGAYLEKHSTGTVILFLGLKTFADLTMHLMEHTHKRERNPRNQARTRDKARDHKTIS
jgi:hypothetical protein